MFFFQIETFLEFIVYKMDCVHLHDEALLTRELDIVFVSFWLLIYVYIIM